MGIQQISAQTYNLLESFNGTGLQGTFGGATAAYATNPVGTDQVIMITNNSTLINGSPAANWQGLDVILPTNYRLTAATQLTMQLDVYSTTAIVIAPKAQGGVAGAPESVTTATHNGSGWQTLTFTFNQSLDNKVPANGDYSDFALHINWNVAGNTYGTPDGRIFYIKNLKGLSAVAPVVPAPTVAAPTPPVRVATDVISIFSNAYSNVILDELPAGFSPSTFTALQIQGNNTWKFVGEFLAMVTNYGSGINLSSMEKMHIDYWTPDANPIGVKIVNTLTTPVSEAFAFLGATTVTGSWQSLDIDMSAFSLLTNKTTITQLLIDPTGPATVYIDNFYFWKAPLSLNTFDTTKIKMYPNPTSSVFTIEANELVESVSLFNVLGQEVLAKNPNSNSVTLDIANLKTGIYVVKTIIGGVSSASRIVKK